MSEADQRWGARLKQARLNAGLSQKMLGIEAGIDAFVASTRINRYELGIHRPDLLTVRKLAKVLGVTMDDIMGEPNQEVPEASLEDVAFFREYAGMTEDEKQHYQDVLKMMFSRKSGD